MRREHTAQSSYFTNILRLGSVLAIVDNERPSGHRSRRVQTEEIENGRGKIGELAPVTDCASLERQDERDRVRRVGSVRADSVVLEELLGVPVVGRDEADAPYPVRRGDDLAKARVVGRGRAEGGGGAAGVGVAGGGGGQGRAQPETPRETRGPRLRAAAECSRSHPNLAGTDLEEALPLEAPRGRRDRLGTVRAEGLR